MNQYYRVGIGALLAVAVAGVFAMKARERGDEPSENDAQGVNATPEAGLTAAASPPVEPTRQRLPRLLDLGAGKCVACKMMTPILEELKAEYADAFKVEFIDVWVDQEAAKKHDIRLIPTQIFFDAEGRELFRHEGFFGKEDILAKWKELGVEMAAGGLIP